MPPFGDRPSTIGSTSQPVAPASWIWIYSPVPETATPVRRSPETVNGETEDFNSRQELDGAFQAVGNVDQDIQTYKDSKIPGSAERSR